MARQNRSAQTEAPAEATTNPEEAPVTESTSTPTEAPAPAAEETPVNLDAFKAVVAEALTEADSSTGELPVAAIEKVNTEYRNLDGLKAKNAARTFLQESMLERVSKLDAVGARGYSEALSNLNAGGGSKSESKPADPVAGFVQRHAAIQLAVSVVNASAPEIPSDRDVNAEIAKLVEDNSEQLSAYLAWQANTAEDKGDAPEVSPVVRAALKAATGKVSGARTGTSTHTGPKRDTAKHIQSAFADKEVGTFLTIAEIAKHKSTEYGDDSPSQGAISARLFPTTTVEGVEPVEKGAIDGKNPKGARKIA